MFKTKNVRIKRFLYCLGFDYIIEYDEDNREIFCFNEDETLINSLEFFHETRKNNRSNNPY